MSVFIELVTDAFDEQAQRVASAKGAQGGATTRTRAGKQVARRPTRGIEIKDDTYAYLQVYLPTGESLPLMDSSSPSGSNDQGYSNFILQTVHEERLEKHQIVETFGESYVFFFGESPRFLNVQALLVNSNDFNWAAEWWYNYENYLRGTRLVDLGARCYLFYDDNIVEGYILGAQADTVSDGQPYVVSLNFRFFVTRYQNISLQNVQYYPVRYGSEVIESPELTNADAFSQAAIDYRGGVLGSSMYDSLDRQDAVAQDALYPVTEIPLPGYTRISNLIRGNPAILYDPDIWGKLIGSAGLVDLTKPNSGIQLQGRGPSTRGLIAENYDEYVGADLEMSSTNELNRLLWTMSAEQAAIDTMTEVNDLAFAIAQYLILIGIISDETSLVGGLGLGPNFGPGICCCDGSSSGGFIGGGGSLFGSASASAGFSASAVAGANFTAGGRASANVSFSPIMDASAYGGWSASAGGGWSAMASAQYGAYANTSMGSSAFGVASGSAYASFESDPLSAVYGQAYAGASFGSQSAYYEGYGDMEYGYNSPFGGAGFGQAGYGDFGGAGFGGAVSAGDPGFLATADFDFNGVSGQASAFAQFNTPRRDNTAITQGCALGGSGLGGRGSVFVGGRSSAFAILATDGEIGAWAVAQASASVGGSLSFGASAYASVYATAGIGGSASAHASASANFGL